jgi:hypothetical protein
MAYLVFKNNKIAKNVESTNYGPEGVVQNKRELKKYRYPSVERVLQSFNAT